MTFPRRLRLLLVGPIACLVAGVSFPHAPVAAQEIAWGTRNEVSISEWNRTIHTVTSALVDPNARAGVAGVMHPQLAVHPMTGGRERALAEAFVGHEIAFARGYILSSIRLAEEIEQALADTGVIPEEIARELIPPTSERERANRAAGRWLAGELGAHPQDAVAVVILWNADDSLPPSERLVFILLRGQPKDGHWQVNGIVYGTARQALAVK